MPGVMAPLAAAASLGALFLRAVTLPMSQKCPSVPVVTCFGQTFETSREALGVSSRFTTLQVGLGGMCVYTLREKGIRREYCGVRGANVEEVGATDIEETKLQTPVLRIYEVSVVPCPQLAPTIVASSFDDSDRCYRVLVPAILYVQ